MTTWLHFALPIIGEMVFLLAGVYCIYRAQKNRIYPALWQFLRYWMVSDFLLLAEDSALHLHLLSGVHAYEAYFYTYWFSFAVKTILILRVLHEMFRHAVRSVPGSRSVNKSS